ncbi:MAG: hypothetical protein Q7U16_16410 [Agitococcus sp.]|nr:hypothetical protein [Agitococcus sp.]
MFKKHVLAVAVMAMTSGVAFADNEAIVEQVNDPTASTATIEQMYIDANVSYGQVIQDAATGDGVLPNAVIYQGAASDVGSLNPTAPAALNGTEIDLSLDAWLDNSPAPYAAVNTVVSNFAYIKQDTTEASQAMIVQLSLDDASAFATASTLFANDLVLGTPGLADGGSLSDGVNDLIAAGVPASPFFDNVADSAANNNNIAAISQGSEVIDRNGDTLGGAAATGGTGDLALIVQMGSDNIAQVLQTGDGPQVATVIQADSGNDAYVAQYSGDTNTATVVQIAVNDLATVYQSGTGNFATVYQHQ